MQQRSQLAIGGRHQGWGVLPAPRGRSLGQPGNELRIRPRVQGGDPVVNDLPRCPRRPSDLSERNRMLSGRRIDHRGRARSQLLGRIDEDLQTRLGALTPPPNAHQHPGNPMVTIDVGLQPTGYVETIAHPRNPRTTPFAWSNPLAQRGMSCASAPEMRSSRVRRTTPRRSTRTEHTATLCASPRFRGVQVSTERSRDQAPNQRARRVAPNSAFSAAYASEGSLRAATGDGPPRKLTSTLLTSPPPNSA